MEAWHAPRQIEVDTGEQTGLEGTQQPPHGQETAIVMHQSLYSLCTIEIKLLDPRGGVQQHTIMIPHKNMRRDSHTDGRSLFRNTLDGTYRCTLR